MNSTILCTYDDAQAVVFTYLMMLLIYG